MTSDEGSKKTEGRYGLGVINKTAWAGVYKYLEAIGLGITPFQEESMRRVVPLGFVAMLLAFMAVPLQAQDVTGSWSLTYSMMGRGGQATERSQDFTFVQDGAVVTGTTMMQMGGRPGGAGGDPPAPQEIAIQDGKMDGNTLTFAFTRGMGERSMTQTFTATVSGNTMEGTITISGGMGGGEPIPFKGVKKEG